jgi:hypothetical protein|tara:strand:+ start:6851 stop:7162 length:312 start_codon:yes stop_codon:yes gene_type:complete
VKSIIKLKTDIMTGKLTNMKKQAFKEAVLDTMLAMSINFPLNMALLYLANRYVVPEFDTEAQQIFFTSVFLTIVFTIVAIVRKTYTRVYFEERNIRKKQAQNA